MRLLTPIALFAGLVVASRVLHVERSREDLGDRIEWRCTEPPAEAAIAPTATPPAAAAADQVVAQTCRTFSARTENFIVTAPSQADAEEFAKLAEQNRKDRALEWLGREMPRWRDPCPLRVEFVSDGFGGSTTVVYRGGEILERKMQIKGPRARLIDIVLPHEVTHTVLAEYFRQAAPRWADEGAAGCSESREEQGRMDKLCRKALNNEQATKLAALFKMKSYPAAAEDVFIFYAQSRSVASYLVSKLGRPGFLTFVATGMEQGWEAAAKSISFASVEDLEAAWIDYLRKGGRPAGPSPATSTARGQVNWWWLVPGVGVALFMAAAARQSEATNSRSTHGRN